MNWKPPIKGKSLKKKPNIPDFAGSLDGVVKIAADLHELKESVENVVDSKIEEVDSKVQELQDEVERIKQIKQGENGQNADPQAIADYVLENIQIPENGKDADEEKILEKLAKKIPKIDEKSIVRKVISLLPDRKADLKIIQESVEIDPMSVIDKIMALPEEKRKKLKLGTSNISGLDQTINAFRGQLSRGYLHGGGGSGTTVTASNGLTKVVNDIQLGGTLTSNTTISGASTYSLNLSGLTTFVATTTTTSLFATTLSLFASSSLRLVTPFIQTSSATAGWVFTLQNATTGEGEWNAPASSGVTTIGTIDSVSASTNGAVISGTTLYMQSASLTRPGLVNTGAQNFSGAKLFNAETSFNGGYKVRGGLLGKFYESGDTNYTSLQAGTGYTGDVELKLPSTYPASNGYALVSTTAGVMSWSPLVTSVTLASVSAASLTTPNSLYTMTSTIPVEFQTSSGAHLLYLNEPSAFVGINNNAPLSKLHVVDTATTAIRGVLADQYSADTISSRITMRKARGTFASPTVIITGDNTASFMGQGYDGTNFVDSARLLMTSTGTISTGVVAGIMALQTANSSGTLTSGLTISSAQIIALPAYTSNGVLQTTGGAGTVSVNTNIKLGSIRVMFDGQGGVITTGVNGSGSSKFTRAGTITGWTIESINRSTGAAVSGSIVIDTWKDTYANFPATVADTIWGGTKPSLSSQSKNTSTGLSIAVAAGDDFIFNVDSATTVQNVVLTIDVLWS